MNITTKMPTPLRNFATLAIAVSLYSGAFDAYADTPSRGDVLPGTALVTSDIQSRLNTLAALDYSATDFADRVVDGRLATLYSELKIQRDWARAMLPFVTNKEPASVAAANLQRLITDIQAFHASYAEATPLGDSGAYNQPDAIVILGANRVTLEKRLAYALPLIEKFPTSSVVLSGGGRTLELEAAVMRDYLVAKGVDPVRLIMETDSLDTVGNAVFTGFALARHPVAGNNLLLVTSSFHAPRSLYLFQRILDPRYRIAVASVSHAAADDSVRVDGELQQQATSIQELLTWAAVPGGQAEDASSVGGTCSVLYQMLLSHKLYTSRWDLPREYADVCSLNG